MARRVSTRGIKIHRHYTYHQAADALGVTPQTVRSWRSQGLSVLDGQKPHLTLGAALKEFVEQRRVKTKRYMANDQFLCMSCNAPRSAYGAMADYIPINEHRGRLEALCDVCGGSCVRFTSLSHVERLSSKMAIVTRNAR